MIVTVDWMSEKFKEFNEKFWDGKLDTPTFKTSRSEHMFGQALCSIHRPYYNYSCTGKWYTYDRVLKMSTYYDQPEKYLEDTILHEMIHLAEYQFRPETFKYRSYDYHGSYFQQEAARINAFGYNIQKLVQEEEVKNCNLSERAQAVKDRKIAKGYYLAYCHCLDSKQKIFHTFKINANQLKKDFPAFCKRAWAKKMYDEVYIYHTSDEEFLNKRCTVKSYYILDENRFNKTVETSDLVKIINI